MSWKKNYAFQHGVCRTVNKSPQMISNKKEEKHDLLRKKYYLLRTYSKLD